jgi:hypothetical protein
MAASLRQAYLPEALRRDRDISGPPLNDDNASIFRKSNERLDKWESQVIEQHEDNIIDVFEASKRQCKIILTLFCDFEELAEIQLQAGSCYMLLGQNLSRRKWRLIQKACLSGQIIISCLNTTSRFRAYDAPVAENASKVNSPGKVFPCTQKLMNCRATCEP